jgi:hypothetical protein
VAENLFLKSSLPATGTTATAPTAPPLPDFNVLPSRSTVPSAAASLSNGLLPPPDLQPLFEKYSAQYGVPLNVVSALAQQESNYNPNAIGVKTQYGQAKGMLQNLDSNAKALGINPFNPEQAIAGAAQQLRERLDKGYSMEDAIKAHFGGDNREQWGAKTAAYGQEVMAKAGMIGDQLMANKPQTAAPAGPDLAAIQAEMDAKEPGRYKVIDPADIAQHNQERADLFSGKNTLANAINATQQTAPSPLTLDNQDKTNAARQDQPSPLTVANQLRQAAGMAPSPDEPYYGDVGAVQYLKQQGKSGVYNMAGAGAKLLDAVNPWTFTPSEIATIYKDQPDKYRDYLDHSAGMILNRFAQAMTKKAGATMADLSPEDKAKYSDLKYATTDMSKSALTSPVRVLGDAVNSLPSTVAMAVTAFLTRGASVRAESAALEAGASAEAAQAIGTQAAIKIASRVGAGSEGSIGYAQQATQSQASGEQTTNAQMAKSPAYQALLKQGYDPETARAKVIADAAEEAGHYAGIVDATVNHVGGQFLGKIISEGGSLIPRIMKGFGNEGLTETAQSGGEQLGQNIAQRNIDPTQSLSEGVGENMVQGLAVGGVTGGATAGAFGRNHHAPQAQPQARVEPTLGAMDPQAAPAPSAPTPDMAQPAQPAQAQPAAPAPVAAPTAGPLTRAAQQYVAPAPTVTHESAGEAVTVRSSDGEMAGTLQDYQDHGQGKWTARVLADDGNAYDFTQADGVQLDRGHATPATEPAAPSAPTTGKVGKIPTLTDVVKPGVDIPTLTEQVPTLTDVVKKAAPDYMAMDEPSLRAELKAIATAIKADPSDKALLKERAAIGKAIKFATDNAGTQAAKPTAVQPTAAPVAPAPAPTAVADLTGDKIDPQWTRFADTSGSLNVPRADMPQIKAEHRGAMTQFLNARDIAHTQEEVPASSLKPTQEEFSPAKVKQALGYEGGERSILVSRDNHILDGHHQWLAKVDGDQPVKVIRLDAPIKQLLDTVREFPSAETANGATSAPDVKETAPDVKPKVESVKPDEQRALDLEQQAKDAYGRGHAITHNKNGMRMRGNDPMSPAEHLQSDEHFLESFRLQNEAKTARGEPIGDIASRNYASEVEKVEAKRAALKEQTKPATPAAEPTYEDKVRDGYTRLQRDAQEKDAKSRANKGDAEAKREAEVAARDLANYHKRHENTLMEGLRRLDPYEAQRAAVDYVKWRRSEGVKNVNGLKPGVREGRTFQMGAPLVKNGQMLVDGLHALNLTDLWKASGAATETAKPASETPKTATPAVKPASTAAEPASKPQTPQQKAKARAEAQRQAARERMGGIKEGEQFIPSADVGYITGGETYTVDSIDSKGNVYVKRSGSNSGTHLSHADFNVAEHKGVTYTKVEKPSVTETKAAPVPEPAKMEEPAPPEETAAELAKAAEYGASNKLVSQDRAAELRAKLKAKLNGSQLNSGIDPEILALGTELAVFHIEAGVRQFAVFAKTMAEDLGQPLEKVRPYLRSWFNGARDMMEDAGHSVDGMDNADTVRAELAKLSDAPATEAKSAPVQTEPATMAKTAKVQTVTTPSGREFDVRSKVVEADSLITSNSADGAVNPAYPKELQPRDRSRSASLSQINDIASNLNPRLLGDSASATDGAPIVSPEGVVESGNGRTLGIQQAYAKNTDGASKYRAWLESQGHDVSGMKAPVLVRERVTPMNNDELKAYTSEANERTTLALSSTERAVADGKQLGDLLHLYHGGDVAGSANREFVRAFVGDVASKSDRGSLMDGDGMLSQDGRRRIEAALLSAAYDEPSLINDLFESTDSDIKSIGGALLDAAGPWAQMRQEARDGQISQGADITPNLIEAVNLVRQARAQGKSVYELVNQNDIFSGELDQATKDWVGVFYRGASLARARSRATVADALLTYTQLARATQPGTNLFGDPEVTGADLLRGTHDKLDRQDAQANQQQGLFGSPSADDQSPGARRADGQRPAPDARGEATQQGSAVNAASPGQRVEPNRTDATAAKPGHATAVHDEPAAAGRGTGEPGADAGAARVHGQRDQRLPTDGAAAGRESGDQQLHQPNGTFRPTLGTPGGVERAGSGGDSVTGKPVEQERAGHIVETAPASDASEFSQRLAAQKQAADTPTVRGDKANIDKALPLLLEPQRDDVLKAEQRYAVGNGMLLTNGTGTGKTASGMGVIVRSINDGKPNALVVVPSDKIAADWVKFAKMLGVNLKQLTGTTDNGKEGQVITTYANFGANDSLALRDWDQVVADEAHYLSSNEKGEGTAALSKLQGLTGHPDGFYQWVRERNPKEWGSYKAAMNASRDAAAPDSGVTQTQKDQLAEAEAEQKAAWDAIEKPAKKAWQARWASQQDLPKTLFLSATPFAYVKSVDYAEGYLFDYTHPTERFSNKAEMAGSSYNSGDAREKFFMQHFGYRMRYNKLTAPETGVDSELMEQNFNQHLKEVGALSGRRLEVPHDYDRKFVMVDDAVGQKIDQGLAYLREHDDGKYRKVYDAVMATFDYQKRMYLLESIKARAVVPMIKEHMALGRKVVVFHDYNKGGGFDPFAAGMASINEADVKALAREAFAARPDIFKKMDLKGLFSPIDTLSAAFPDALFFNGTVPKATRRLNADTFNDDTSGKDLIVLQSDAGREGVSLHDTTGQHMRALINLGMPGKPVAAIQIEGRTYRTGQASDAAFRYLTTGTAWEASAFASKIAERASTAENLALGTDARGLKQAFIDAYNNADDQAPSAEDGKGGKALDRELAAQAALTPFQKAKAYYFAQQKNSKRRDLREGTDYFATPEPLGLKMAEWANIQPGDHVLEPSAGHGAIARFFPQQSHVTMVEPSYDLSQRAALANGNARIINDTFESLHRTNKYDAVVMNPPFGNGGKTAIEHVAKAAQHLREGGRIVALIPRGGLTDKRLATFLDSDEAQSLHRVATFDLPPSTFERAGTAVNTQVVVLEKHSNPDDAQGIHARTINLSNAESTGELFDRIEHLDVPDRMPSSKPEPKPELIEHVTGKGKTITGLVRSDLTKAEAQEIDPYTFPKNGGWFIRAKHLGDGNRLSVSSPVAEPASHQEVRDAITQGPFGPVVNKLIDAGHIVIHGNVQSLPEGHNVRGVQALTTPDGTVHLVAANLTPENANGVLLHEMFHSGGEQLVGSQRWGELMKRLDGLHRQAEQSTGKARDVFDRARERVQQAQDAGAVADGMTPEEFGAYAIEEHAQLPAAFRKWVDDLVGTVKHWLFSRYGKQLGQVTPAQLRAMAKDALVSMALDKRGELFGKAGTMFSVKLSDVFDDIKADADATSFSNKIGPETLPQRMTDRWRQLTDNLGLRFRQAAVDRYAPLMRNDHALYGADTLEGSIASSSWVLARMSQAAGGAVDALLHHGRIYLDPTEKVIDLHDNTQGLGDTLKKLGSVAEMTRFMGWIAANRSKRLLGEGRENLFTPAEIEAGIKFSGGKLENGKSRSMLYQQVWKEFQQHRDDVLGIAEQSGIITPEQRATWSDEFYVPFYRVIDDENLGGPSSGGGGLSRQQAYKKLKGGKQHLNDLLENTLLNFHHLIQASLKNQAATQAMANAEQLGIADKTTEAHKDKKASTFVMENGIKQWYNVSDPLTFKAVSALSDPGVNTTSRKVMRSFKRFFTNMTTITPQFVVANAIRDSLAAMATSPTSAIPLKTAFKGALTYGNKRARARMMASGGAFHFGQVYGHGAADFKASLNGSMRTAQVLKDPMLIPNTLMKAWHKYHEVTDFAENMNRAGIWEHNQGKGKLKAAFEARDLMDFSAHGDAGIIKFFTDVVPFLNARLQGLDKLYRSGGKPALKTLFGKGTTSDKQAFARFATVVGALTAFSTLLYLRNKDDEDYRKLEDWQRDTYWSIKIGNSMFFIPKPFEVGSIATMGERLAEQFVDPTVGGDKFASRMLHMLSDTFAMNPTPQAFKPIAELWSNQSMFTGRPIEDQSMQKLSPSLRVRPDSTRLAEASSRGIERALDTIGVGNSALSPIQIDYLIQGYLGAVGSSAMAMADTYWRGAQGEQLPARSWDEYQPIKRFYKDLTKEDNYNRYGTDFYTALKASDQAYADLQHLSQYGQEQQAQQLQKDKPDELGMRKSLTRVAKDLGQINAEMKQVQMSTDTDSDTKRQKLDSLRSMRNLMTEQVGKALEQRAMARRSGGGQ